jgi:succinyl-CoA synthetase beta subunit
LDINPLLVTPKDVIALDARVVIDRVGKGDITDIGRNKSPAHRATRSAPC